MRDETEARVCRYGDGVGSLAVGASGVRCQGDKNVESIAANIETIAVVIFTQIAAAVSVAVTAALTVVVAVIVMVAVLIQREKRHAPSSKRVRVLAHGRSSVHQPAFACEFGQGGQACGRAAGSVRSHEGDGTKIERGLGVG